MKRIGDILTRYKEAETVKDEVIYKQVTIGTNYKGVRLRGTKPGIEIGTKNQWLVKAGQFILSRIDARNSAFGIIPDDLEGALVTNDFMAYEVNEDEVNRDFFNVFLQSPQFLEACIKASRGNTNRKRVQEEFFLNYEVNLPDIDHQRLLIQKIERAKAAMAIADSEITHQQSLLDKLRQAILQEAIQGKLTEDWRLANPDLEPASQLLKRIQTEKARLIAEKKIRKEKPLPKISPEEIPFEIPEGWEWCRIGHACKISSGKGFEKNEYSETGVRLFQIANVSIGKTSWETTVHIPETYLTEYPDLQLKKGDLVMALNRPLLGRKLKVAIITEEDIPAVLYQRVGRFDMIERSIIPWLFSYLSSDFFSGWLYDQVKGVNIPFVNQSKVHTHLFPFPPLAEQAAIVERVEALMTTCRLLESEIEQSRAHADLLLQAVLKEAFAPAYG